MIKLGRVRKNETIASTIINGTGFVIFAIIVILSSFSLISQHKATVRIMKDVLDTGAKTAADSVSWAVKSYKNVAESIGTMPELTNPQYSTTVKKMLLQNKANEYKLLYCKTVRLDGYSDMDDSYRGDRDYFKMASNGQVVISDPLTARTNGQLAIVVAAPVWKNGIYKGGSGIDSIVFCAIPPETLNDIVENLQISKHSDAYIIGYDGTTVAAIDDELVLNRNNNIKNALHDKKYESIADIEMRILGGDYSVRLVRRGLSIHCYASCPIEGTPDWTIIIETPLNDYMKPFYIAILLMVAIAIGAVLFSIRQTLKVSKRISEPVEKMAERLRQAAAGDFSSEVNFDESLEEVKIIGDATQILLNRMDLVINSGDSYKSDAKLEELFNFANFEALQNYLYESMHIQMRIMDTYSNVLVGTKEFAFEKEAESPIIINGVKMGTFLLGAEKDCVLSEENLDGIAKSLAEVVARISESSLKKSSKFESWRENIAFNTKNLVSRVETASNTLSQFVSNLEKDEASGKKFDIKATSGNFIARLRPLISKFEESTEYARFTDYNTELSEEDYYTKDLIEDIKSRVEKEVSEKKENFIFTSDADLHKALFGDATSIAKIVTRICVVMQSRNRLSPITIVFSSSSTTFGGVLDIKVHVASPELTENEIGRLKILARQKEFKVEGLNSIEQKLVGALRLAQKMNCSFKVDSNDNSVSLSLSFPQLPAEIEEKEVDFTPVIHHYRPTDVEKDEEKDKEEK